MHLLMHGADNLAMLTALKKILLASEVRRAANVVERSPRAVLHLLWLEVLQVAFPRQRGVLDKAAQRNKSTDATRLHEPLVSRSFGFHSGAKTKAMEESQMPTAVISTNLQATNNTILPKDS